MNNIPKTQNTSIQIQRLAAQRQLYSTAKIIFGVQLILSAPIAVASSIVGLMFPVTKCYVSLWGVLVSICTLLWLTPWQKRLCNHAAKIQEIFDCDVLELPWNDIKVGKKADPELVKGQADKFGKNKQDIGLLKNWYAPVVGKLPIEVARVVCQRSNCWWDSNQRRRYAHFVIIGVAIVSLSILLVGLIDGLTVDKLFLVVVSPLMPAFILGFRQYSEQIDASTRLDQLKEHADLIWSEACDKKTSTNLLNKSRNLQDEIFDNRKRSPLVFDWIFKRLRDKYEIQMKHGAQSLAEEAIQKLDLA